MSRLSLNSNMLDVYVAMSDGNPGAIQAIMEIMDYAAVIDQHAVMGGIGVLLMLDDMEIYGSRIYMLWNDVCNRNVTDILAILRAYQLGQLAGCNEASINHAIDNYGYGLNIEAIRLAVKEKLPKFNTEYKVGAENPEPNTSPYKYYDENSKVERDEQ